MVEVAFAGRSNVGKSSLINALVGQKSLARTSRTPGRTQQINFFDLGGHSLLVVRLHRDLGEMLDQDVSLTDLYRFPTVRSLTRHLQDGDGSEQLQQATDRAKRRRDLIGRRRKGVRRN